MLLLKRMQLDRELLLSILPSRDLLFDERDLMGLATLIVDQRGALLFQRFLVVPQSSERMFSLARLFSEPFRMRKKASVIEEQAVELLADMHRFECRVRLLNFLQVGLVDQRFKRRDVKV